MSKNASVGLTFKDDRDRDFTDTNDDPRQNCRIMAVYQGGQVDGHFLKFQKSTLTSTASNDDTKAYIRIQSAFTTEVSDKFSLWVITDRDSPTKALKLKSHDDGSYSFTVEDEPKIALLDRVSDTVADLGDFLFKKFSLAGTSKFYLTSYTNTTDGKSLLLAVDGDGHLRMDNPPTVDENDPVSVASDDKNLFVLVIT
ncbi:uncharacterized protein LOC116296969 [Actinia tenebrosa]|uniref:Uncharacterized protein LOC116296969 n=1 Tax=Actinia tenebrosa TaxID=6105 RepID=A0A6P8HX61_ACTTE|nr:uncharacterized protein LOC116296969 [Actinia tenebrosa]